VLITSVGKKVWLVKAFKKAGWLVQGQDTDPLAVGLKFCNAMGNRKPDFTLHTRDAEIPFKYHDKLMLYYKMKELGLWTPEVQFVKPRVSFSGKKTQKLVQEFVSGLELSIDAFFLPKTHELISLVPRTRDCVVDGEAWESTTIDLDPVLTSQVESIGKHMKLKYHNVLQCIYTGAYFWTDINPRYGGMSALAIKAGLNSPSWIKQLVQGKPVRKRIGEYKSGLRSYSWRETGYENNSHS